MSPWGRSTHLSCLQTRVRARLAVTIAVAAGAGALAGCGDESDGPSREAGANNDSPVAGAEQAGAARAATPSGTRSAGDVGPPPKAELTAPLPSDPHSTEALMKRIEQKTRLELGGSPGKQDPASRGVLSEGRDSAQRAFLTIG